MCVWQQKATTLVDARGEFDLAKARASFAHGNGIGQVGRPSDAGGGRTRAPAGRAHQRHSEVLHRREPARHSGDLPRGMSARPRRARRDELSAADRAGGHVQPGAGRSAVHDDGARGARPRHASGAHAGRRRRARSALGTRRGDVRRGSVPRRREWASRPCAAFRATRRSGTRRASSPRSSTSSPTDSPSPGMNCAPANVSLRVLRETFLSHVRGGDPRGRRAQRDGVVQRSRRRSVARQSLAAARRAARRVGLRADSSSPTTTRSGSSPIAPRRTATTSRTTSAKRACSPSAPA